MDSVNSYVEFTKMCMHDNYFQYNGYYYRQMLGTSMGNALSPFLANIFMADLETRVGIRYVYDIFCVMKKNTIDRMLVIMKFTHAVEDNETLCFSIHSDYISPQHLTQISSPQLHDSLPCHHTTESR
jgi:hypothetical protein